MYFDTGKRILATSLHNQLLAAFCLITLSSTIAWAEGPTYDLHISTQQGQLSRVEIEIDMVGHLKLNPTGKKITELPIRVDGKIQYDEKMLELGTSQQLRRSVRYYQHVQVAIEIGKGRLQPRLEKSHRLIVAQADKDKSVLFSPVGKLSRDELDLIDVQGNSLLFDVLLPNEPVSIGKTWKLPNNSLAQWLGLDVISQSDVFSQLVSVKDQIALVESSGIISGAVGGVATEIKLKVLSHIDLKNHRIDSVELSNQEKRSIGHAEPGFEIVAKLKISLQPISKSPSLSEESLAGLSLEHSSETALLRFESTGGSLRFLHDRRWRVMTDHQDFTILRLVDSGDLIAQCNISRLPDQPTGKPLELSSLQKDVQRSLGKNFGEIVSAKQSINDKGLRVLRVVAAGKVLDLSILWTYYHLSNDQGYRAAYVFTLEGKMIDRFANADEPLVTSLEFLKAAKPDTSQSPTPAAGPPREASSADATATDNQPTKKR